jgi:hypothetical protein
MIIRRVVLVGLPVLLLIATKGHSQPDAQSSSGSNGGPGGNLSRLYEFLLNGKDAVNRAELDKGRQMIFDRLAEKMGVTTGQITRAQIDALGTIPKADRPVKTSPVPSGLPPAGSQAQGGPGNRTVDDDQEARAGMTWASPAATADRQRMAPTAPVPVSNAALVYHSHNLPKDLPAWFQELDTNHDAQISLYEWKVSGRPIADFLRMDRNNDGFLTVEEVLFYMAETGQLGTNTSRDARPGGAARSTSMARNLRGESQPSRTSYQGQPER